MPLTDTAIRKARPGATTIKLSDGGGLQLHVHPNGSKYWRLAYRYGGKQKKLSFGVYPEVSLAEARKRREAARALLREGRDPMVERRVEKVARAIAAWRSIRASARASRRGFRPTRSGGSGPSPAKDSRLHGAAVRAG